MGAAVHFEPRWVKAYSTATLQKMVILTAIEIIACRIYIASAWATFDARKSPSAQAVGRINVEKSYRQACHKLSFLPCANSA
jgi:hypothetical protein